MNYKITGAYVLTLKDGVFSAEQSDLYVMGNRVYRQISARQEADTVWEAVDARNRLILPGLTNMHTHSYMTVMRNYADDVAFDEWLFQRCMPVEDSLPQEAAYWTSLLGCMEMVRTGTTNFADMHMFRGQVCRAVRDIGMRGVIGRGLVGEDLYTDGLSRFQDTLAEQEEFEASCGGRLQFALAPHAIYSCSVKLLEQVADEAAKRGMLKHIHLSESVNELEQALEKYGKTPVALLRDIGFLDAHTLLAHCVQMQGDDISIIAESGATIVTNPASNAKLGNGFAPVWDFLDQGINVTLGTDGAASNNTLNLFREMGLLSLIHKGIHRDPEVLSSNTILHMVTDNAWKILGTEEKMGVLTDGSLADLIFLDLNALSLFPANNMVSALCYSANGSEVTSVMVDGTFIMRNREFANIDEEQVRFEVNKVKEQYL